MAVNFASKESQINNEEVQELIQWTTKQSHLPVISALQASLFLQTCNNQIEPAKIALERYFTFKTICSDLYLNRNPLKSPLCDNLDGILVTKLPKNGPQGHRVILVKWLVQEVDKCSMASLMKYMDMICSLHFHEEGSTGDYYLLFDVELFPYETLKICEPSILKKYFYYIRNVMPWRLKGLHYFNLVPFMTEMLGVVKPTMPQELTDMLYIHQNVEDMKKYIPIECLPKSRAEVDVLLEQTKRKVLDNVAFFEWEDRQTVQGTSRLDLVKTFGDVM